MKQLSLLLLICCFAGSEAWFLDWFKTKKPQTYGTYYPPQRPAAYSYYRPQYKVPVWQTLPSGYAAQPVQQGGYGDTGYNSYDNSGGNYGSGNAGTSYGNAGYGNAGYGSDYGMPSNAGGTSGYGTGGGGGGGYAAQSPNYLPPTTGGSYNSYNDPNQGQGQGGFAPVYEVTAPIYGGSAGNINVPATGNTDYTGNKPLLSVPVYFPKGTSGTTYSNGVSGFYDGSVVDGSNSIGYANQPATSGQ